MSRIGQREQKLQISSAQRDMIFFKEREAERQANAEKTAKLRALRMAKEASEREAAAQAASEKPVKAVRVRAKKAVAAVS